MGGGHHRWETEDDGKWSERKEEESCEDPWLLHIRPTFGEDGPSLKPSLSYCSWEWGGGGKGKGLSVKGWGKEGGEGEKKTSVKVIIIVVIINISRNKIRVLPFIREKELKESSVQSMLYLNGSTVRKTDTEDKRWGKAGVCGTERSWGPFIPPVCKGKTC